MTILSVENISKNYGKIQALKQVNFSVPPACVFGILGPNGSGKTTLLGIIMNVLKATSGSYKLFDEEATDEHRKRIGTLLETPNFYHYLSAIENLKITAAIKGHGVEDIQSVLETVNLWHRKDAPFSSYSLGMKQRLAIGAALLGNPEVLVFDEPTNGLDPVGIAEIRGLIKKLSQQGKTIIMASHLLDEVEKVCTHVAILKLGTLITSGNVNEIFVHDDIVELSAAANEKLMNILESRGGFKKLEADNNIVNITYEAGTINLGELNKFCFDNGITLSHLVLKRRSLETKFFELTK